MNQENQLKLHDIKDIVSIPDNSIFIFLLLVFLAILVILGIIFFIMKLFKNKKIDTRKINYNILKEMNYTDSKVAAYEITKAIRVLAKTQREKKLAQEIIEELEQYKYKKEVSDINETIKIKISTFMDAVDV